jgi:hypothetical protein
VCDEAVSATREGLDVARGISVVLEHLAQFLDMSVQAVFEINEGVFGPEVLAVFLAAYQLARVFQQKGKHSNRLALEFELLAGLVEFRCAAAEHESTKTDLLRA